MKNKFIAILILMLLLACKENAVNSFNFDNISDSTNSILKKQFYSRYGGDLIISSRFSQSFDILQLWRMCMQRNQNTIFTFFSVELFPNTTSRDALNTTYKNSSGTVVLNQTSSDNILATLLYDKLSKCDEYTSGWHLTTDNKITARTTEWHAYVNGNEIKSGDFGSCETIDIVVKTEAYDPFIRNKEGNPYLVLFEETINYRIQNGNIFVSVSRDFKRPCLIKSYGGVASMAKADQVFFPNGHTTDFVNKVDGIGIKSNSPNVSKASYPNFNRFIQRNLAQNWYEAVYLLPDHGIGDHSQVRQTDPMYWTWTGKVYHRVSFDTSIVAGEKQEFCALYSWFIPIADTNEYLAYITTFNDHRYLFIDVKKGGYNGLIEIPNVPIKLDFIVKQKDSTITIGEFINTEGLYLQSTGVGSVMLQLKD